MVCPACVVGQIDPLPLCFNGYWYCWFLLQYASFWSPSINLQLMQNSLYTCNLVTLLVTSLGYAKISIHLFAFSRVIKHISHHLSLRLLIMKLANLLSQKIPTSSFVQLWHSNISLFWLAYAFRRRCQIDYPLIRLCWLKPMLFWAVFSGFASTQLTSFTTYVNPI